MKVFEKLVFPNGSYVPNRIAKAAMEENMADLNHAPSEKLMRLYQAWANGGVGLIITGNVMVDRRAMTGPGGVVLEDEKHLDTFKNGHKLGAQKALRCGFKLTIRVAKCKPILVSRRGHHQLFHLILAKCQIASTRQLK